MKHFSFAINSRGEVVFDGNISLEEAARILASLAVQQAAKPGKEKDNAG